ncbi:hypothetical protein ACF05W_03670 [Streptomyces lydicus]|uniref:hypothetical protein n=1 Tax=Streptomyces lydicus TaxID=47763 RepID=UPI0036F87929
MFEGSPPRLLPWTRPDGAPCYLSTDDRGSRLSLLADDVEDGVLAAAGAALEGTEAVAAGPGADPRELCHVIACLRRALRDVLRVAVSRGDRLAECEE